MDLLQRIMHWLTGPQNKQLINHVVALSREPAWRRVAHRVVGMRPAVARGFIRAHASTVVAKASETLAWQYPHMRISNERIGEAALAQLVDELQTRAQRLTVIEPAEPMPLRRAA